MGLITMTERDLQRIEILSKVIAGRMTMVSASHVLDLSERQVRRLLEWSAFSRKPQPVDGEGPVSRFAARAAHVALLFLTLAVPLMRLGRRFDGSPANPKLRLRSRGRAGVASGDFRSGGGVLDRGSCHPRLSRRSHRISTCDGSAMAPFHPQRFNPPAYASVSGSRE